MKYGDFHHGPFNLSIASYSSYMLFGIKVNVNVVYALKQKFSEEGVGLCEEMGLQPISELFTA